MSVATKLEYLNNTKQLLKENINNLGGNLTNEPFRQYASVLEGIYESLPKVSGIGASLSLSPSMVGKIKLNEIQGNTLQNGTPTPSSPVPIQSVTGLQNVTISNSDNTDSNTYEVNLGKNLINLSNVGPTAHNGLKATYNSDGTLTFSGTTTGTFSNLVGNTNCYLPAGTYTFSRDVAKPYRAYLTLTLADGTNNNTEIIESNTTSITFTTQYDILKYRFSVSALRNNTAYNETLKLQMEKGSTPTSFSPYFTPYELNDEDNINKSTGKNLFDIASVETGKWLLQDGTLGTNANFSTSDYISVNANENYYLPRTATKRLKYYDSSKQPLTNDWDIESGNAGQVLTIPSNAKYVRFTIDITAVDINTFIFNEGSTALPYEPYGKVWYIEKQTYSQIIGNVSTTNARTRSNTSTTHTKFYIISGLDYACATNLSIISDYYPTSSGANDGSYSNDAICSNVGNYNRHVYFSIPNEIASTIEQFITYINSTGIKVVYQLANPIYEVITNTELINQLESLNNAKSEDGTTNINVTSEDLSMLLNVGVLKGE